MSEVSGAQIVAQVRQEEQPRFAELHFFARVDVWLVLGLVLGVGPDVETAGILLLVVHSLGREGGHDRAFASDLVDLGDPARQLVHIHLDIVVLFDPVLNVLFRGHHAVDLHAFQHPLKALQWKVIHFHSVEAENHQAFTKYSFNLLQ